MLAHAWNPRRLRQEDRHEFSNLGYMTSRLAWATEIDNLSLRRKIIKVRFPVFSPPQPLIHVFAKNLVAFVSQEAGNRAVLLAMAVKDKSMEGLKALKEVIRMCQVW